MTRTRDGPLICTVQKVFYEGPHGPYALATCPQLEGEISFSLQKPVWQEGSWPEEGTEVLLEDVRKKRGFTKRRTPKWRAYKARYVRPSDYC